jgi:hypothetical protein
MNMHEIARRIPLRGPRPDDADFLADKRPLEFHPLANIFPLLEGEQLDALAADIRDHGLREPIVLFERKILDGRNRARACAKAKVKPQFENYTGSDPLGYVISLNLKRRHLNESQRAMVATQLANMRQGERTDRKPSANLQKVAQATAAERLNVSVRTVAAAAKVRSNGTAELIGAVEQGKIAVSAAAKVAKHEPDIQRSVVERVKDGSDHDTKRALHAVIFQKRDDARKAALYAVSKQPVSAKGPVVMLGDRPVRVTYGSFGWRKIRQGRVGRW